MGTPRTEILFKNILKPFFGFVFISHVLSKLKYKLPAFFFRWTDGFDHLPGLVFIPIDFSSFTHYKWSGFATLCRGWLLAHKL